MRAEQQGGHMGVRLVWKGVVVESSGYAWACIMSLTLSVALLWVQL